jgi:hypothetical protein
MMWKEATVVQSGLLTQYMTGQTEGNHKTEQMHLLSGRHSRQAPIEFTT